MRLHVLLAGLAAAVAFSTVPVASSQAEDRGYRVWEDDSYTSFRTRPRVVSGYFIADPYAYRYEPRGYYPYYDAGYWRPLCGAKVDCVPRAFQPPYWKAWGYPK
ncbi:MAG TPA: hypothetical protein VFX46_04455, partial [Hyphomicrobiaceae bacterium]|nr:hypothetical protein [Hyphomicrobiaceae bacterium]